jgi:hypothetical protein
MKCLNIEWLQSGQGDKILQKAIIQTNVSLFLKQIKTNISNNENIVYMNYILTHSLECNSRSPCRRSKNRGRLAKSEADNDKKTV